LAGGALSVTLGRMLRHPTNAARRRVAAHACPGCRRLWALSGSRIPSGSWVIACKYCGWHAIRGGHRPASSSAAHSRASTDAGHPWWHGVLFYDEDDQLVRALEDYLVAAWEKGGVGLVIATPEHRAALRERLAAHGLLDSLGQGRFVELDAASTLEQFMGDDGVPDPERFASTVGSLVRDHAAEGSLQGFGEMVDLLWAAGNGVGALELEELWSQLQDEIPFSLLCAYAERHVDDDDRDQIARVHDHVGA
jgi:ribosomal protein L37AE/L43A